MSEPDAAASPRTRAEAELARIAGHFDATAGLAALHLGDGRGLGLHADAMYPLASTVKVPIALAVLQAVDQGRLSLAQPVEILAHEFNPSGPLGDEFLHPGVALSVHNLLEPMITRSDNTATDVLLRLVGGPAAVQGWLAGLGIDGIRVNRTVRDLLLVLYGLDLPDDVSVAAAMRAEPEKLDARRSFAMAPNAAWANDPRDHGSPAAMVELLRRLWQADGISPAARATLLPIMGRTTTGLRRLRGRLPPGIAVADKTGTGAGTTNDVGFLTLPDGGTVAIAVYVKDLPLPPAGREDLIAELARTVYDHFVLAGG